MDKCGSAYVTGYTESDNYPTTPNAFDTTSDGFSDAFVTKINASGSALAYSIFLGGLGMEQGFAIAVLAEAALSFLGFGTPPPTPSWGRMLQESQEMLFAAPRLAVFPGVAIALAVLGFNLLGDGLRDRFDPKLQDRR